MEERYDIETLSIDRVLEKGTFYRESYRKYVRKAILRPIPNFGK